MMRTLQKTKIALIIALFLVMSALGFIAFIPAQASATPTSYDGLYMDILDTHALYETTSDEMIYMAFGAREENVTFDSTDIVGYKLKNYTNKEIPIRAYFTAGSGATTNFATRDFTGTVYALTDNGIISLTGKSSCIWLPANFEGTVLFDVDALTALSGNKRVANVINTMVLGLATKTAKGAQLGFISTDVYNYNGLSIDGTNLTFIDGDSAKVEYTTALQTISTKEFFDFNKLADDAALDACFITSNLGANSVSSMQAAYATTAGGRADATADKSANLRSAVYIRREIEYFTATVGDATTQIAYNGALNLSEYSAKEIVGKVHGGWNDGTNDYATDAVISNIKSNITLTPTYVSETYGGLYIDVLKEHSLKATSNDEMAHLIFGPRTEGLSFSSTDIVGYKIKNLSNKEFYFRAFFTASDVGTNFCTYTASGATRTIYALTDSGIVTLTNKSSGIFLPAGFDGIVLMDIDQLGSLKGTNRVGNNYNTMTFGVGTKTDLGLQVELVSTGVVNYNGLTLDTENLTFVNGDGQAVDYATAMQTVTTTEFFDFSKLSNDAALDACFTQNWQNTSLTELYKNAGVIHGYAKPDSASIANAQDAVVRDALYIRREVKYFNVTVNGNTSEVVYNGTVDLSKYTAAEVTGKTHSGWTDGTNDYALTDVINVKSEISLTPTYTANNYKLTVKFVDAEGNELATASEQTLNYNADYDVAAVNVTGYTASQASVTGTMLAQDTELTIVYTINSYKLTVKFVDGQGNELATKSEQTLNYNASYDVAAVNVTGYTASQASVSGTMPAQDTELAITYTVNEYKLTVEFVDGQGNELATKSEQTLNYNASYDVAAASVTGYTASQASVSGTMPAQDTELTITYTINSYKLTVKFVDADGNELATSYETTLDYGASYNVPATEVEGYKADSESVSGTIAAQDTELTITYTKNKTSGCSSSVAVSGILASVALIAAGVTVIRKKKD